MTRIVDVYYPYVYTECGKRLGISEIKGNPKVDAMIEKEGLHWVVKGTGAEGCET